MFENLVVFKPAVKEGGAGGGGKPGALILVSVPTIQPVVTIPLPILLLFQTLFHRKQLQEDFEARFKAVFESRPVSLSSTGNASDQPLFPSPASLHKRLK